MLHFMSLSRQGSKQPWGQGCCGRDSRRGDLAGSEPGSGWGLRRPLGVKVGDWCGTLTSTAMTTSARGVRETQGAPEPKGSSGGCQGREAWLPETALKVQGRGRQGGHPFAVSRTPRVNWWGLGECTQREMLPGPEPPRAIGSHGRSRAGSAPHAGSVDGGREGRPSRPGQRQGGTERRVGWDPQDLDDS